VEEVIASGAPSATASAAVAAKYFHLDHQGSVLGITDAARMHETLSYDAWGKRRNADGSDDTTDALTSANDRTGYTGQEELDGVDLIDMNGRVYDPISGRFTAPDPTVPNPANPQDFNRYSYVLNNPLNYVDPTGFQEVQNAQTYDVADAGFDPGGTAGGAQDKGPGKDGEAPVGQEEKKDDGKRQR